MYILGHLLNIYYFGVQPPESGKVTSSGDRS